ncbi:hypothetical protein ABFS82_14G077100 [Erythranthe guttata]|uniref:receptor-like protein kinase ANXUR2 n=1 Tax=Erythranthe guttata TaxID=4155 RepID=UPI00064DB6A1|nr:PREDICTED: receptor-like protein kinase ANXUR2 [Erythranthe guttata]|eukprot:XP_012827375.1 PREDICTED: receptor-like protein kinase ANXUR2 [Erythranthe guttata]
MRRTSNRCDRNHILASFATIFLLLSNAIYAKNHKRPSLLILISCGSSNNVKDESDDGTTWQPDTSYLGVGDKSTSVKAEIQDPSLPSDIPYMTARIFQSQSTYQFPLQNSTSRTLLRLHFYPSSYPNFNISDSYFSVVVGGVTLLNNFSASLAAEALSQAYFIKEYYLAPSQFPTLHLTFKPSDKSFAFINGIELISMPPLFDTDPTLAGSIGPGDDFDTAVAIPIQSNNMETMFRLNVGGQYIAPTNDSGGLMRSWYDDSLYIYGAADGVAVQANTTIRYKGLPSYIAPLDLYSTYRSMGPFVDVNKNSNLSWLFHVDPNFMYLVRFHWCDCEMTKPNQRVFDIFINNKIAASQVDLYAWTGSIATPTIRDYVVQVKNMTDDSQQLWVALHPTDKTKAEFADVLLNGLEIFKLSDNANSNLAGPNR